MTAARTVPALVIVVMMMVPMMMVVSLRICGRNRDSERDDSGQSKQQTT